MEKYQWNKKRTIKPLPYHICISISIYKETRDLCNVLKTFVRVSLISFYPSLRILPFPLPPLSIILLSWQIFACIPSETKPVETDGPRTSVLRINFTLASSKEYRHPRRNSDTEAVVAPRNIRASVSPTRERERERVTCMAIKWTTLTIHQFSIS